MQKDRYRSSPRPFLPRHCVVTSDIKDVKQYYGGFHFVPTVASHFCKHCRKMASSDAAHCQGVVPQSYETSFDAVIYRCQTITSFPAAAHILWELSARSRGKRSSRQSMTIVNLKVTGAGDDCIPVKVDRLVIPLRHVTCLIVPGPTPCQKEYGVFLAQSERCESLSTKKLCAHHRAVRSMVCWTEACFFTDGGRHHGEMEIHVHLHTHRVEVARWVLSWNTTRHVRITSTRQVKVYLIMFVASIKKTHR